MQIQQVTGKGGVKGRYVPGVGATPVRCTFRVGSAALVAPTPGIGTYQPMYQPWTRSGPESVPAWTGSEYLIQSKLVLVQVRNPYLHSTEASPA